MRYGTARDSERITDKILVLMTSESISVRVLFFGAARDAAGSEEVELKLDPPHDSASAFAQLLTAYPNLRRFGKSLLLAVNQEYAQPDRQIADGDELAVFPPVSGGSRKQSATEAQSHGGRDEQNNEPASAGSADVSSAPTFAHDFFELTTDPIDVDSVARRVVLPECGATVTLDGYAREWTRGRRTLSLVYEAYAPMAISEMERLGQQAHEKFDIAHIGIVHRT